jgi:tetratricopeptide (TPR) repeat protein
VLLSFCGESVAHLGDFQLGEALCEKGLRFAQDIKDLHAIAFVETMYATVYLRRGDGEKTIAHAKNAIKHCEETQFATILGMAWKFSGWGYLFLGDLETAREHMERGRAHDRKVGMSVLALVYYQFMSQICLESGDWERARGYAEEGLEGAKTHIERHTEGWLRFSLGRALAKADSSQSAKAEKLIRKLETFPVKELDTIVICRIM